MSWKRREVAIAGRRSRLCQYVTGLSDQGPRICGTKTQNVPDGRVPICVYHAQFSRPPQEWPND